MPYVVNGAAFCMPYSSTAKVLCSTSKMGFVSTVCF